MAEEPFIKVLDQLDELIDVSLLSEKKPLSRAVCHLRLDLLDYDIIEPCKPEEVLQYVSLFLVEKKDGDGRLVADGRSVNAACQVPPRMPIMTIRQFLIKMGEVLSFRRSIRWQILFLSALAARVCPEVLRCPDPRVQGTWQDSNLPT